MGKPLQGLLVGTICILVTATITSSYTKRGLVSQACDHANALTLGYQYASRSRQIEADNAAIICGYLRSLDG